MSSKMLMTARFDQRLSMNQQLRQAIALLQYNSLELHQLVQQQLDANPLLEIEDIEQPQEFTQEKEKDKDKEKESDDEFDLTQYYNHIKPKKSTGESNEYTINNYSKAKSLRDHLLEQTLLCHFNCNQQLIAEIIIDSLDDDGFLTISLDELYQSLTDEYAVASEEIAFVLKKVQSFEPSGVASLNIRDCLLNQLRAYEPKDQAWKLANGIILELTHDFSITRIKKIIKEAKESNSEYNEAIELIKKLNFYPGSQFLAENDSYFDPEIYVRKTNNAWKVYLTEGPLTNIRVNKQYYDLIKNDKDGQHYHSLKQELEEAKWLVNGIKKRNETLVNVASYIIDMQKDFLDKGLDFLKPMNINEVASALGIHESTVSRVTNGKYISTPRGIFELKYFFPSHVATQTGENRSDLSVKSLIKELISKETTDNIYSDSDLVAALKEQGINIARRTVTKYRESMNILASYQRQMHYTNTTVDAHPEMDSEPA